MSDRTHWRDYARKTALRHLGDPDHVAGGVRWNATGTRAMMRFRGPVVTPQHMTPTEARDQARLWFRSSDDTDGGAARRGADVGGSATAVGVPVVAVLPPAKTARRRRRVSDPADGIADAVGRDRATTETSGRADRTDKDPKPRTAEGSP